MYRTEYETMKLVSPCLCCVWTGFLTARSVSFGGICPPACCGGRPVYLLVINSYMKHMMILSDNIFFTYKLHSNIFPVWWSLLVVKSIFQMVGELWSSRFILCHWMRWGRAMPDTNLMWTVHKNTDFDNTMIHKSSFTSSQSPISSPPFGDPSVCGSLLSLSPPQTSVYARFLLWSLRGAPSRGLWRHLC